MKLRQLKDSLGFLHALLNSKQTGNSLTLNPKDEIPNPKPSTLGGFNWFRKTASSGALQELVRLDELLESRLQLKQRQKSLEFFQGSRFVWACSGLAVQGSGHDLSGQIHMATQGPRSRSLHTSHVLPSNTARGLTCAIRQKYS